jgi:hypothetical protein
VSKDKAELFQFFTQGDGACVVNRMPPGGARGFGVG